MPTVTGGNTLAVVLQPNTTSEQIITISAFTSGATTATCSTTLETGGTLVAATGVAWVHGPTAVDFRLDTLTAPTAAVPLNAQKITGLANGTASTDAAAFGQVPVANTTAGTVTTSAVGDTSAAGTSTLWAPADHRHGREAFGASSTAVAQTSGVGVATTEARSDHTHQGVTSITAGTGVTVTGGDGSGHGALTVAASAAASPLLAISQYAPGTAAVYSLTTTFAALDTTNITVSFIAPASGNVLLRMSIAVDKGGASAGATLGVVTHGTSTQVGVQAGVLDGSATGSTTATYVSVPQKITGLTPGNTYQWDMAAVVNVTGPVMIAGNPTTGGSRVGGPAVMEVWAA
jgi:hypothetical protein